MHSPASNGWFEWVDEIQEGTAAEEKNTSRSMKAKTWGYLKDKKTHLPGGVDVWGVVEISLHGSERSA